MNIKNQNNKVSIQIISIDDKIFIIRNQRVMIDSDLAEVYGISTKRLNQQINRNIKRFPSEFAFQLNESEFKILKSNKQHWT